MNTTQASFISKNLSAVILCFFGFVFYTFLIVYRFVHFSYSDWDQALINQSLWNGLHGKLYASLYGFNTFGDHATFVNILALPFFVIFPHPLTISILAVFLFALSGLLLYTMIQEDLDSNTAFLMTFIYFIFPPNFFAICHDFNTELLAPFFILGLIYFYRKKQLRQFYGSFLFLFLFKENMAFIVAMIGLWGLVSRERSRLWWGIIPIGMSFVYFVIMIKYTIPYFRGMMQYSLWVRYQYLGSTPLEVLGHLMQFKVLMPLFLNPVNIHYLRSLFGVLLIPAFLSPSLLLLGAPIIFYHLASSHMPEKTIYYYYAALITPFILLASAQTLRTYTFSLSSRRLICWVLIAGCCIQLYAYRNPIARKLGMDNSRHISAWWSLVKRIPSDAGVVSTFAFLPALSLREHLYSLHKVYTEEYQNSQMYQKSDFYTGKIFKLPDNVQWALIDFNDGWLRGSIKNASVKLRLKNFLKGWTPVASVASVVLYTKGKYV